MRLILLVILWAVGLVPWPQIADLAPGYWERTPLPQTGLATFYAAGMMEHVLAVRAGHGQVLRCDECVGTVALLRAGDIGRKVWLQPPGGEPVGPFLVIDCARYEDVPMLVARGWAVDVSYEVGQLWGMDRPLAGVTVLSDPADLLAETSGSPQAAPTRFVVPADKVVVSTPTLTPAISPTPWRPTPWPTRLPVPLMPVAARGTEPVAAVAGTPTLPLPTPLTPVITTPTPAMSAPGERTSAGTPSPTPQEVAVGRPGSQLLAPAETPSATPTRPLPFTATPTRSSQRTITPGPTATPILPRTPWSAATPQPGSEGSLLEWLRSLLGVSRP